MSKLTLTNLNLPDNTTARRLLELIGEYQVRFVLLEEGVRFTAPDLSEAKGHQKWDFTNNFLPNLTTNEENESSNPDDVWVLENEALKSFKEVYQNQLGISLGRINKLTVVGWNTAYHYLVQGHSETAREFSDLGADTIANSFNEPSLSEDPVLSMLDSVRMMRIKQLELEKEQVRQAQELEQTKEISSQALSTAQAAKEGLENVRDELASLKELAIT